MEEKTKLYLALTVLTALIVVGTLFYHFVEGWSFLDGVYFSSTTLTTIGFGDLHPTKPISKLFTIFYVLSGVSVMLYTIGEVARIQLEAGEERIRKRLERSNEDRVVWAHLKKK
jgi:voltage-gated potassium channel